MRMVLLSFLIWQSNGTRPVQCRQDGLALKGRQSGDESSRFARGPAQAADMRNVENQFGRVLVLSRASDADFGTGPIRPDRTPKAAWRVSPPRRARRFPTISEPRLSRRLRIPRLTKCICTHILRDMTSNSSPLDCNCFAIRQAARYVSQMYERHLTEVGITAAQFTILASIGRRPGVQMAELADSMVMDRTTLVRALKPLQRDGLVEAAQESASSRAVGLRLTATGRDTLVKASAQWRAAQAEFEAKFGEKRAKALRQSLFELTTME
jgi:DNA-binding MarR family transcriptional regulator